MPKKVHQMLAANVGEELQNRAYDCHLVTLWLMAWNWRKTGSIKTWNSILFQFWVVRSVSLCSFFCWWQIRKEIAFPQWLIEFAKNLSILPKNVCQVRFLFQFCGCFDVLLDFLLQEFLWFRKQLFYSNFIASLQRTNLETVHNLVDDLNVFHRKQLKSWFRHIMAMISYVLWHHC